MYYPDTFIQENITLGHLATHHSGLPHLPHNLCPKNMENPYEDYTGEDLHTFLTTQFTIPESDSSIGLGWIITNFGAEKIIWHNGGTGGFRSFIGFCPERNRGVVILSNSTDPWPDSFGFELLTN